MVKPVRTTESDRVRGYRHPIPDGPANGPITTNSRSLESLVHPNTLPMRHVIVATPVKTTSEVRPRKNRMLGGQQAPEAFKLEKRRASAQEMHEAAKHSPQVEAYFNNSTLNHAAFTSRRRRNDQEE